MRARRTVVGGAEEGRGRGLRAPPRLFFEVPVEVIPELRVVHVGGELRELEQRLVHPLFELRARERRA